MMKQRGKMRRRNGERGRDTDTRRWKIEGRKNQKQNHHQKWRGREHQREILKRRTPRQKKSKRANEKEKANRRRAKKER